MDTRLPLTILSGFLGSGKTTLLARLLKHPEMAGTAVLVNEFGEIGLDHLLLEATGTEAQLVAGGCICCTSQSELQATLRRLLRESASGATPPIKRVVIESSGLSDPGGIITSVYAHHGLASCFEPPTVVTAVDASLGLHNLDQHGETLRQVSIADRLVLTKLDIAEEGQAEQLRRRLRHLNGHASLLASQDATPRTLCDPPDVPQALPSPRGTFTCGCHEHTGERCLLPVGASHTHAFESHGFVFDEPMDWDLLSNWLGSVAFFHGPQVLRLKGLVFIDGDDAPYAIHGMRHLVHEPSRLSLARPSDGVSRIVFITSGLARSTLETALERTRQALPTP